MVDRDHRRRAAAFAQPTAAVRSPDSGRPAPDPHHLMDRIAGAWPLVGRDAELAEISRVLLRGDARGVALVGGAGVGKTRLARAAVSSLVANGRTAEWVLATEGGRDVPLGAMAHLLPPIDPAMPSNLLDLLRLTRAELERRAGDRPLVLAVDDADRLDPSSANVVREMLLRSTAALVLTLRTGSAVPDAIGSLLQDGLVRRLELAPIEKPHLRHLLAMAMGADVDDATLHRVWRTSGGNPLFVRELVVAGVESGAWSLDGDLWRWDGSMGTGTRLREMIESRLARLSPSHRPHLEMLAFAEPLGVAQFEQIAGIEVVDELERLELLGVERDGLRQYVRLAHPLYGEVLRAATPPLRARAIQRELASGAATGPGRRREDVLTIARWQLASGTAADPAALVVAAGHAAGTFDFVLAERYARAAIDAGAGADASDLLAHGLRGQGRVDEADRIWQQVEVATEDRSARADLVASRAFNLFFAGRSAEAAVLVDEARRRAEPGDPRHRLDAARALLALYSGAISHAIELARPVSGPDVAERPRLDAIMALGPALALQGGCTEALALVDEALPLALAQPTTGMVDAGVLVAVRFLALRGSGRLHDALDEARNAYEFAVDVQQHEGMAVLGSAVGQACLDLGDLDQSIRRLREAAALLRERDRNGYLPWCLGTLTQALVMAGDVGAAEATLEEADRVRIPGVRLLEVELERGRAWVAFARGDRRGGERILREAATWAIEVGQVIQAAAALHDLARQDHAADDLAGVAAGLESPLVHAWASHAEAVARRDAERIVAAARRFEELGARLLAVEAHAQAAVRWRDDGRAGSAAAAAARVRELLQSCPGARPPALPVLEGGTRLTPREHEVAVLAAQGQTSRQIAAALFVSVRTVENHLHRAYEKLGVRNRTELAAVLQPG